MTEASSGPDPAPDQIDQNGEVEGQRDDLAFRPTRGGRDILFVVTTTPARTTCLLAIASLIVVGFAEAARGALEVKPGSRASSTSSG